MKLEKYKLKLRLILVETPTYENEEYKKAKDLYEENIKEFHKRYLKMITRRNKKLEFKIKVIGFDGLIKEEYNKLDVKNIFKLVDAMPLAGLNINPINLSLYSDYNKKTTTPGLGFKNKDKALYTISTIKSRPIKYQVSVISTMLGRAKNHPNKTKEMDEAIKIFEKWLDEYHKSK